MSYATLALLTDRFGERLLVDLTDRSEVATGMIDTDVIDRTLADTDAVIDGYLSNRYTLPVSETPSLLVDLALSIAIYKLHVYEPNDKIEADYKDAIRALRDISSGAIRLSIAGVEVSGTGGNGVRFTDRERPLTAANMKGFI